MPKQFLIVDVSVVIFSFSFDFGVYLTNISFNRYISYILTDIYPISSFIGAIYYGDKWKFLCGVDFLTSRFEKLYDKKPKKKNMNFSRESVSHPHQFHFSILY